MMISDLTMIKTKRSNSEDLQNPTSSFPKLKQSPDIKNPILKIPKWNEKTKTVLFNTQKIMYYFLEFSGLVCNVEDISN